MAAAIMLGFDIMESQRWRRRMRAHASSIFSYIREDLGLPLPPGRIWSDEAIGNYSVSRFHLYAIDEGMKIN
jgi:hypothetical protein